MSDYSLDLLNLSCPMNYVRAKLKLDSMQVGQSLELLLSDGEAIESVSKSLEEEGHTIISKIQNTSDSSWSLKILKV